MKTFQIVMMVMVSTVLFSQKHPICSKFDAICSVFDTPVLCFSSNFDPIKFQNTMIHTKQIRKITKPVTWDFDYDIYFFIETSTDSVKDILPPLVRPYEVRPGVSMLAFGLHRFEAGNLNGRFPGFVEANCAVVVQPNLSINMPMPRFAIYVLYVASTCKPFIEYATKVDKMPAYNSPGLQWTISEDGTHVSVEDDFGPMFELKNTLNNPSYKTGEFYAQALTCENGKNLFCTPVFWKGSFCEHQDKSKDFGKIYNHPSLNGIKIDEKDQNCYVQMFTPKGEKGKGTLTYWDPIKIY